MADEPVTFRDVLPAEGLSERDDSKSGVTLSADSKAILLPAMTEEEVARSASSRGKRMVRLEPPEGVTPWEFSQVISGAYLCYMRDGKIANAATISKVLPALREPRIAEVLSSLEFRNAMLVRGVDYSGQSGLSPEQDMAIAIMSTPDGLSFEKKLKKAGVAPSKWRAWLKQKAFREVWDRIGGRLLSDHENDMMVALTGQALQGDVGAIKYAFEVSGRHNPAKQQAVDAETLVMSMIQIIQEEVKDPDVLQRIASRFSMVAGTRPSIREIEA